MPPRSATLVRHWQQRLDHDACLRGVIVKSLLDSYRGGAALLTARSTTARPPFAHKQCTKVLLMDERRELCDSLQ